MALKIHFTLLTDEQTRLGLAFRDNKMDCYWLFSLLCMSKKEKMKHITDLSASIEETKKAKTVLFYSTAAVAECPLAACSGSGDNLFCCSSALIHNHRTRTCWNWDIKLNCPFASQPYNLST